MSRKSKPVALCLLIALLATCAVCAASVTELKVMSFNIWVNGGLGLTQCIAAIRVSGADLIGLQECNAATAQILATNLGFHLVSADGCPILSRHPIVSTQAISYSRGVTVQLGPGHRAHFFNTHLTAYPYGPYDLKKGQPHDAVIAQENKVRTGDLKELLAAMKEIIRGPEPCFLVGDFNAPSHLDYTNFPWPTSIACADAGLVDSYRELHSDNRKYPGRFAANDPGITWTPKVAEEPEGVFDRIDFVYYSKGDGVKPMRSVELDERNCVSPWPSDHRAVLTTFAFAPMPSTNTTPSAPR